MHRMFGISMILVALLAFTSPTSAFAASHRSAPNGPPYHHGYVCAASQTNGNAAFPYKGTMTNSSNDTPTCNGNFMWGWTSPTPTGTASWTFSTFGYAHCDVGVWIPDNHAGGSVRYDVWGDSQWLGWPGHTINQNTVTRYQDLGTYNLSGHSTVRITLTDQASGHWQIAAYSAEFGCF